jgi:hypothetical protein
MRHDLAGGEDRLSVLLIIGRDHYRARPFGYDCATPCAFRSGSSVSATSVTDCCYNEPDFEFLRASTKVALVVGPPSDVRVLSCTARLRKCCTVQPGNRRRGATLRIAPENEMGWNDFADHNWRGRVPARHVLETEVG